MNEVTARFLERCAVDTELLEAGIRAPYKAGFASGVGGAMLPRPLFISEKHLRTAAADVAGLIDLVGAVPVRLFDGDAARYAAAIGVPDEQAAVALRDGLQPPPRYGRADLVYDGTRFRLMEANIGSELGGCHIAEANRALLEVDAFRRFADEYQLINVEPGASIAAMLRRVATPVTGGSRDPVVAVAEWTGNYAAYPELYRMFCVELERHGITVHLAEAPQLLVKDGKVHFNGEPIDIVLRYFTLSDVCDDPTGGESFDRIRRAHLDGGTVLFTHPQTNMYSYKDNLAFLSDMRNRWAFSAEESALIDRLLPWTRRLDDGRTDVDGESVDLRAYCLAHRTELVAKPHWGYGAMGTYAGWQTAEDEWARMIEQSPPNAYIVQRRARGTAETVIDPTTGERRDWLPIHGMYIMDGYGGDYVRALPADGNALIAVSTGALNATVFACREGSTAPDGAVAA